MRCMTRGKRITGHHFKPRKWGIGRNRKPILLTHGVVGTYTNYACRCKACSDANRAQWEAYKERTA